MIWCRSYRGRHRKQDAPVHHHMVYWQRHCLWHARCETCGAKSLVPGGDGADAMHNINHVGGIPQFTSAMEVAHG